MNKTESIAIFLRQNAHADLAALYHAGMECQVNVAQDNGERIQGEYMGRPWHGYTDGFQQWKMFRIPRNANTSPVYEDSKMTFDLSAHAEGIGMTGWDWQNLCSRWVAFDFDAITGHKDSHTRKLNPAELEALVAKASEIPWLTIRHSTGGGGIHIYAFIDPSVPTQNHNEHAAIGRAILGKMSGITGYGFESKVDVCGQNMWVWHRKIGQSEGRGLALIKRGIPLDSVPPNWQDHIRVITGARKRTLPKFTGDISSESDNDTDNEFLELTGQNLKVPLSESHLKLVKFLEENRTNSWWDQDHHILVTHTWHLAKAHAELQLKGIFKTKSTGTEAPNDQNCFMIPLKGGAWVVRRYSMGVEEDSTWEQDGRGWTRCYFNREPDLGSISNAYRGLEDDNGSFVFKHAVDAIEAATALGAQIRDIPDSMMNKEAILKAHPKDGRLIIKIKGDGDGVASMPTGWLFKKQGWQKIFNLPAKPNPDDEGVTYDKILRHLVTESEEDAGWAVASDNGWRLEPLNHCKAVLQSMSMSNSEINTVIGSSVIRAWKMVNKPFQAEFPGNREWNRGAAQLRFVPSLDTDNLSYPTWLKILSHCGRSLDYALQDNAWADVNGVVKGSDYLKIWIASMFRHPNEPLPYLFFYGEENTGKSIFHEALSLLLTQGYVRADHALVNKSGFSGELRHAILCVVEEIDLRKSQEALNRIKDFVTARQICIHAKGETPYHTPNTTHWVQCNNKREACPILPGDSRITMLKVEPLDAMELIPKARLIPLLEKEAPDFLAALALTEIPPSNDRLFVPMIHTSEKLEAQSLSRNALEIFIAENTYKVPGSMILFGEFHRRFVSQLQDGEDVVYWNKKRMSMEFPFEYPRGRNPSDSEAAIGNISFEPQVGPVQPPLVSVVRGKFAFLVDSEKGITSPTPKVSM